MRLRLKGINSITKTLADGSKRTYYYAWKGGPPLYGEPGTPEFIASYNEAVARKVIPPRGALLSALQAFQASGDFLRLADATRKGYVWHIKRIENEFGDFPLSGLTDRRTRGIFMAWRDRVATSSGTRLADYSCIPGWYWPASCHGRLTAAWYWQIPAPVADGYIAQHGVKTSGPLPMKQPSSRRPHPICICH